MKKALISQKDLIEMTSGIPRMVHEEIQLLKKLGYKVYVVSERIDSDGVLRSGGTPVKTFRWPFSGLFRRKFYAKRVKKFKSKLNPDLTIGHGDIFEQDVLYIHNAIHLAHELIYKKPLPSDHEVGFIHNKILSNNKFKVLVCNSKMLQKDMINRHGVPRDKTVVIYPEFNPEKFNCSNEIELKMKTRKQFNISENDLLIGLITSGDFKKRNVSLFIDTANELLKTYPNLKFVVAGKNKDRSYNQKVQDLGIEKSFYFAPSINDVERYYLSIDIFVLPAYIEEFGLSVLEAMACHKPVVVNKTVGASEILESDARDFILNELSVEEFSSKLVTLINNSNLRKDLGDLNFKTAMKYSNKEQGEKLKEIFTSC